MILCLQIWDTGFVTYTDEAEKFWGMRRNNRENDNNAQQNLRNATNEHTRLSKLSSHEHTYT